MSTSANSTRHRIAPWTLLALAWTLGCSSDDDATHPDGGAASSVKVKPSTDAGGDADAATDDLLVKLDDGVVRGDMAGGARLFRGIPFAKPPLAELRWKAPEPNDPWDGVLHNAELIEGCPQLADQGAPPSTHEDCLYLNVWSPSPAPKNAAVMVWIHGGGNFSGGAGIPVPTTTKLWFDGRTFAERQGVVLVTIQYRLGPLGFMSHPALEGEGAPLGNQGLLDQRMALRWVQRNIDAFGGDPDNVTIFGESAGSADVCYHVASPGSRGLFHRAISQSGGCTIRSTGPEDSASDAGASMEAYGEAVGCPAGDGQLACMREVSVEDLLASAMQPRPGAGDVGGGASWRFSVVIGGPDAFLPDSPQALFDRGDIADVPYLLGSNNDEGTTFTWQATRLTTEAEYQADLTARFGDAAADVEAVYPASAFAGDFNAARARVVGDQGLVCGTHDTARRAAAAGRAVYLYNFNVPWAILPSVLHAGHASEISHAFGTPYLPSPDPDSEAVGEAMNTYWANFAKTGDPNGAGQPAQWPQFEPDADRRLQLDASFEVIDDFRVDECAFWRGFAGAN